MPTLLNEKGFKFKIYSNENDEPPHVHIFKGGSTAKYWIEPNALEEYSYGFTVIEKRDIKFIIENNLQLLIEKWYENFSK